MSSKRRPSYVAIRQLAMAAAYSESDRTPVNPSEYVRSFDDVLRENPVVYVVLYIRASKREQRTSRRRQLQFLRRYLRRLGVVVLGVFTETHSGWDDDLTERAAALRRARELRAVLLCESVCRLLRHVEYRSNRPVHPFRAQWEKLKALANGVILASVVPPDATPSGDVRAQEVRRQHLLRAAAGELKERKAALVRRVCELRWNFHCSYLEIEWETGLPRSTFRGWLTEAKRKGCGFLHPTGKSEAGVSAAHRPFSSP